MNLQLKCNFKAAAKPFEYAEGKTIHKFWVDVDTDTQYPSIAEFNFFNNKVDISQLKAGDEITVNFNISGRKWEKDGKSGFNQSLIVWKIDTAQPAQQKPVQNATTDGTDDLPF